MLNIIKKIGWALCCLIVASSASYAANTNHVNIAAFHKVQSDYEFEAIVMGRFSDFISEMEQGSEILFLNHTAGIQEGDVITFNADVLREAADSSAGFSDQGFSCSFNFHDESTQDNTDYSLGGFCSMILNDKKQQYIITDASLPDTSQGEAVWVMLYEDEKNGIAFYANVSAGK